MQQSVFSPGATALSDSLKALKRSISKVPAVLRVAPHRCFFFAGDRAEPAHVLVERDAIRANVWLDPVYRRRPIPTAKRDSTSPHRRARRPSDGLRRRQARNDTGYRICGFRRTCDPPGADRRIAIPCHAHAHALRRFPAARQRTRHPTATHVREPVGHLVRPVQGGISGSGNAASDIRPARLARRRGFDR
jgi:hypothetical protein